MASVFRGMIEYLDRLGIYDIILPFLILFALFVWILYLHFGKKNISYKRGILIYIAILFITLILSIFSKLITNLLSIGILIFMIIMYFKKQYTDIVHVYFFSLFAWIISFIVIAISELTRTINEAMGSMILLIATIGAFLYALLNKKRKPKK